MCSAHRASRPHGVAYFILVLGVIGAQESAFRGGYSIYPWVGRCGSAPHSLTLFKTKSADFPTLFKTEFRFLIPNLRHSQNISAGCLSSKNRVMGSCLRKDTLFKTKTDKINTLFKTKIPKNIPWLAARPHEALITEYPPPPGCVRYVCQAYRQQLRGKG